MSNSITRRLGMAYFSTLWLVVTFPVLLILSVTAMVSYGRGPYRGERLGAPRSLWVTIIAVHLGIFALGSLFYSPSFNPPDHLTPPLAGVLALFGSQLLIAVLIVLRAHRRRAALAAVLPFVWIGLVVAFVAYWAISAGGTLGAL